MCRIWALSDLHLSTDGRKPMDVFGPTWHRHQERLAERWDAAVAPTDVVLLGGDLSWAMKPADARDDLAWLGARSGRKVIVKGNHDYWWPSTRAKLASILPHGTYTIKKNGVLLDGLGIFGVRGGDFAPVKRFGDTRTQAEVDAILERELRELRLSIADLARQEADIDRPAALRICLCHYPPLAPGTRDGPFARLIREAGARHCLYGHLHGGEAQPDLVEGEIDGVVYRCVSCDLIDFSPLEVGRFPPADAP